MWPHARGSLPLVNRPVIDVRLKRHSAPELTPTVEKLPVSRRSFLPEPHDARKPGPYYHRLFSTDQLTSLSELPADEALSTIISCLPEGVPKSHTSTLATLLYSVLRWATNHSFQEERTSLLLTVYLETYRYCVESPWRTQAQLYAFFKESLLRSSVRHLPHSVRVLDPEQCKASLVQFCRCYLTCLPLVRLVSLPNYRLHLTWDITSQEEFMNSKLL